MLSVQMAAPVTSQPVGTHLQQHPSSALPSLLSLLETVGTFTYVKQPLCDSVTKSFILSAPSRSKLR